MRSLEKVFKKFMGQVKDSLQEYDKIPKAYKDKVFTAIHDFVMRHLHRRQAIKS